MFLVKVTEVQELHESQALVMEDDIEKATLLVDDILKEKLREVILVMFLVASQ